MSYVAVMLRCSNAYLTKQKKAGVIRPDDDGRWRVDSVRAQLEAAKDPGNILATAVRNQLAAVPEVRAEAAAAVASVTDDLTDSQIEALYGPDHKQNLLIARSLREREAAARERIARQKDEGALGLIADFERESFTAARITRDAVMRACAKIAPLLAPIADAWEIERRLAEAMRAALQEAADGLR